MNDTADLFEQPTTRHREAILDARAHARRTDPSTSKIAAERAQSRSAGLRILALQLLSARSLTDFELAAMTNTQQTSVGKRRHDLMVLGYVQPLCNGYARVTRPAPSGSPAQVWQITPAGREFLRGAMGAT